MTTEEYKRAAICAMCDFGHSDRAKPTERQEQAVEDYFAAITPHNSRRWAQRMMGALRVASKCVSGLTRNQHTKVLMWVREIADKGS